MYKKVYIEITNVCNLKCSFCIGNKRINRFMSIDEFKTILEKLKGYTKYIYLHVLGEPLMHPYINELIDLAAKYFYINITTNGYFIDKIKNNKNIRQINISLHSFDNTLSLDDYLNNIFHSVDFLSKTTYISYRLWQKKVYEDDIIKRIEKYYKVKINGKQKIKDNVFIDFENSFDWPKLDNNYYSEVGNCYGIKDHIAILVDGTVVPCCLDACGIIKLGNIFNESIKDIQNKVIYKELLNGFKNNKKIHPLCKRCNFIK